MRRLYGFSCVCLSVGLSICLCPLSILLIYCIISPRFRSEEDSDLRFSFFSEFYKIYDAAFNYASSVNFLYYLCDLQHFYTLSIAINTAEPIKRVISINLWHSASAPSVGAKHSPADVKISVLLKLRLIHAHTPSDQRLIKINNLT